MDRLDDIERRLAALEDAASTQPHTATGDQRLLEGLIEQLTDEQGAIVYAGVIPVAGQRVTWQYGLGTEDIDAADWSTISGTFAALGNPVRLTLLQRIVAGVHDVHELARTEGIGTTGQVYHHLRALVAAGWLRATTRGNYEVPAKRLVPLYACLVAGGDL